MGLFDFVKDAGEKVLGREAAAEAKAAEAAREEQIAELTKSNELVRYILGMGFPVEGLKVDFDDGVATVIGTVESTPVRQNIVLGLGNIQGVAQVDDRLVVSNPTPPDTMYTVKSGDSLGKIAKEHYGNAGKYPVIFEANQPMLTDPNKIYPGQVLRIPALDV